MLHFLSISSPHERVKAEAISRASKQAWLDVSVAQDAQDWNSQDKVIQSHLDRLTEMLFKIGSSTLFFGYAGLAIDKTLDVIAIEVDGDGSTLQVSSSKQIDFISPRLSVIESQAFMATPHLLKASDVKAIVLAPQLKNPRALAEAVAKILSVPYPQEGAAELTHFALLESGHVSDVTWIEISNDQA